ncbi:MAG TPA: hypothetical protein VNQ79_04000 [Blastocatellia bacterium]|nr:hypothetical protein [Blastocatellia bacterium]
MSKIESVVFITLWLIGSVFVATGAAGTAWKGFFLAFSLAFLINGLISRFRRRTSES